MAIKAWINKETESNLRSIYFGICNRDKKTPKVKDFRKELDDPEKKPDFQKKFGKDFRVPSKSWLDKKDNVPAWRRDWLKLQANPLKGDLPWHLGTWADYPLPADAIPIILEIQKELDRGITIRVVKWLGRLYLVLKNKFLLYLCALMYAAREQTWEISKTLSFPLPFDTSDLDAGLLDAKSMFQDGVSSLNLSPENAPLFLELLSTFAGWLAADQHLIGKEEKRRISEGMVNALEKILVGHSLGGFNKESDLYAVVLLFYFEEVLSAIRLGYFFNLSNEERETQLVKLQQGLPKMLEAYQESHEDLKSFFDKGKKIWESLRVKKE